MNARRKQETRVRHGGLVLAILAAALAAAGGDARAPRSAGGLTDEMRSVYATMFGDGLPVRTMASLQEEARQAVADGDQDGGGLSRRDIELARAMAEARARAERVRHYFGADLDRDGALTLDEHRAWLRTIDVEAYYSEYESARRANRPPPAAAAEFRTRDVTMVETFNAIDGDGDGRLTLQEVYAYDPPRAYWPAQAHVEAAKYLVLDSDGDGTVTMAEVDATSAAFLAEQSLTGAGPRAEAAAAKDAVQGRPRVEDVVTCRQPAPSAAARIVRLGTREGGQLSSVALGGQNVPTFAVSVEIEPGTEPLYIVATSNYPTIWRLSGATQRVEAFIGSSRARDARSMWPAAGVTGLPRRRFHAVPYACFGDFTEGNMRMPLETSEAARLVTRRLGRTIDVAFGAYQPQGVRLPSARPFEAPMEAPDLFADLGNEAAAREWRDFLRYFRAGIARLSPRQVVSRAVPEPFEVYSYGAGLAQLLELGALTPVAGVSDFEIRRPIRFPAGLAGGHSETFRLPDGVPPPVGDPAHSRVLSASNPRVCLIGCR